MWRSIISIHAVSILKYFSKLCCKWKGDLPSHGPVEADYLHIPGQPEPAAQPAYCCWWFPSGPAGPDSDKNKQHSVQMTKQKQSTYTMRIECGYKTVKLSVLQSNVYKPEETDRLLLWVWGTFHSPSHSQPSSYCSLWFTVDSRGHKQYFKCLRSHLHEKCEIDVLQNRVLILKKKSQRRCFIIFSSPRLNLFGSHKVF